LNRIFFFTVLVIFLCHCAPSARYSKSPETVPASFHNGSLLIGKASYYGKKFHGRKTANGEIFNMYALTAAHKLLPFNTVIRVKNLENSKSVTVRINDRGPFKDDRILDLSYQAAHKIGMIRSGVIKVEIKILELGKD
jgi:rare lipoprotein A